MARNPRALAALGLSAALSLQIAQAEVGAPMDTDPPDRAARLSLVEGPVTLQPVDEQDWVPALLNRPLTTGDSLWTQPEARAEIQVGLAAVRLDGNTRFSFLNLDDDSIQMHLTEGVISVNVRALRDTDRIEIDTPNLTLSLLYPGSYRVEVDPRQATTIVKVRDGETQAHAPSQNVIVRTDQTATFTGVDPLTARFESLGEPDPFDAWTRERERRDYLASTSPSAKYVAPEVTGYEDLDEYGTWSAEPEYGPVWTPSHVAAGWSPYRYGHWTSISPWGWTWIDAAPWGYAPFHYGRWAHVRNRWCWVPGPRHGRAVYAPANVGWIASRDHVSWYPLGPHDVYLPEGRYSRRYVERVNVTNAAIIHSVVHEVQDRRARSVPSRNRAVPGAVMALPRATFAPATAARSGQSRPDASEVVRRVRDQQEPRVAQPQQVPQHWRRLDVAQRPQSAPATKPAPAPAAVRPAMRPVERPRVQSSPPAASPRPSAPRPVQSPAPSRPVKAVVDQVRASKGR